jgi:hypothetical protein
MQSVKQEPIYLPAVENSPQPSHCLNLIRTSQSTVRETWNIRYLFAFRPQMTQHLAPFTQEMMLEPSQLRPGLLYGLRVVFAAGGNLCAAELKCMSGMDRSSCSHRPRPDRGETSFTGSIVAISQFRHVTIGDAAKVHCRTARIATSCRSSQGHPCPGQSIVMIFGVSAWTLHNLRLPAVGHGGRRGAATNDLLSTQLQDWRAVIGGRRRLGILDKINAPVTCCHRRRQGGAARRVCLTKDLNWMRCTNSPGALPQCLRLSRFQVKRLAGATALEPTASRLTEGPRMPPRVGCNQNLGPIRVQ